jgi:Flp pilus assembly protein TadG
MRGCLTGFAFDRSGNFGIISALLAVPLVLSVGVALDFSSISSRKSTLQNAIDSAVLAIAREGKDVSDDQAKAIARTFLDSNFDPKATTFEVSKVGTRFTVTAKSNAGLAFGSLLGYQDWPVQAKATADIAYASYEIALVLDTTGSMKGGKLSAMKDAVLGLVDTMSTQVNDEEKLKFAMVPFATFVNVGPQYGPSFDKDGKQIAGTGAKWLDLKGESEFPQSELSAGASRFQIYSNVGQAWPGCIETRYAAGKDYDVSDAEPAASDPKTLFVPAFGIDEPDMPGYFNSYIVSDAKPKDKSANEKKKRWAKYGVKTDAAGNPLLGGVVALLEGLLGGGDDDDDDGGSKMGKKVVTIDTSPSWANGKPKGPGNQCETQPLTTLTNDYAGLKAKVKALQAAGTTNIMEGVAWGNRVLSPGQPFGETNSKAKDLEKIMIVLTDGTNVFGNNMTGLGSSYSSNGYLADGRLVADGSGVSATTVAMNERTLKACETAKTAGIEVYTIRLEEPNVATGDMLEKCASAPDHYFDVPSRSQLDEVFAKIKDAIVRVRIAS